LTSIDPLNTWTCEPWDLRIPGLLPATLPWSVTGDWATDLLTRYSETEGGSDGMTMSALRVPMAVSDTIFDSSKPAIFPVDLATSRFVTVGEAWRPVY
jgi:hypothetical protein